MKIRCYYNNSITDLTKVDELVFSTNTQNLKDLAQFKQQYPDIFIWVEISDSFVRNDIADYYEFIEDIKAADAGIMIHTLNPKLINELHQLNLKVSYGLMVPDFEGIQFALSCGVDDFGITSPVTFEMDIVSKIIQDHEANIWICPDIAQTSYDWEDKAKAFYVLPQHTSLYENFNIHTLFIMRNDEKTNTVLDIYKQGEWTPYIAPLIFYYTDTEAEGALLPPHFGARRLTCRHNCMKNKGHCVTCSLFLQRPNIEKEENF